MPDPTPDQPTAQAGPPRPRIWWSASKRSFYTLLVMTEDEAFTLRSACEPGHEMFTWYKPVPKDAVELLPAGAGADQGERALVPDLLRMAETGRREYARNAPQAQADVLLTQAEVLRCAAEIAEGNYRAMQGYLPSWRWPEFEARVAASSPSGGGTGDQSAEQECPECYNTGGVLYEGGLEACTACDWSENDG
jgi:hypothetical protein